MKVFGSSGVRGLANDTLTPEYVLRIAAAASSEWDDDWGAAVARDTRTTGRMLADAAAAGLASTGLDVHRLGVVPTPAAQAYAERAGIPALVITASHNPPEYNGVKLIGADGIELGRPAIKRVEDRLAKETVKRAPWATVGATQRIEDVRQQYVSEVRAATDRSAVEAAELTVAVDPGHGAGSATSPQLFRELGCEVVTVNAQEDGHFPGRNPEPVGGNLRDLRQLVRAADADLGVAHDGDADRAVFADERGEGIEGDAALAALAAGVLDHGETVVSAVNVSQRLVDVADDVGATVELTPIGSTNIITRVRELQAAGEEVPIAGEGNGGILFPAHRLARDGLYTATKFLELVATNPASEVVAPFDAYENVRLDLAYRDDRERDRMLGAAERHAREADAELTTMDGYRLDYGDGWVLVRASGTEPLVRVYAEARSGDRATQLANEVRTAIEAAQADA